MPGDMSLLYRCVVPILVGLCLLGQALAGLPHGGAASLPQEKERQADYQITAAYPFWRAADLPVDEIPFEYLDQIDHFSIHPGTGGTLEIPSRFVMPALIDQAHLAEKRVVLVVGGQNDYSAFAAMAADPTNRSSFVANLVAFVLEQGYDGVRIDWESLQSAADRQNLGALMGELRTGLDSTGQELELSIAVTKNETKGQWIDVEAIAPLVSHFLVMSFRYYSPGAPESGHSSPLYPQPEASDSRSVDQSLRYWAETRGVPWSKLYMGVASSGVGFDSEELHQPFNQFQQKEYRDIKSLIGEGYTRHWDSMAQVPYLTQNDGPEVWSYDDPQSVGIKREYVLAKGLAGVAVWEMAMDRVEGEHELLKALADAPAPSRAFVPLVRSGK